MAGTFAQLEALVSAINQGALRVRYGDKEVTYRSLEEMKLIRRELETELGLRKDRKSIIYPSLKKGLD